MIFFQLVNFNSEAKVFVLMQSDLQGNGLH